MRLYRHGTLVVMVSQSKLPVHGCQIRFESLGETVSLASKIISVVRSVSRQIELGKVEGSC